MSKALFRAIKATPRVDARQAPIPNKPTKE